MLFDFGWSELMLISVVALVVIGPKDLPRAMRAIGYWMRRARSLSQEFQGHVDELMREAELAEIHEDLKKVTEIDLERQIEGTVDPEGSLREGLALPELEDTPHPALEEAPHPALEEASHPALEDASHRAGRAIAHPAASDAAEPTPEEAAEEEVAARSEASKPAVPAEDETAALRP